MRSRTRSKESVATVYRSPHAGPSRLAGAPANTLTTIASPGCASTCQHESTASSRWGERTATAIDPNDAARPWNKREHGANAPRRNVARRPSGQPVVGHSGPPHAQRDEEHP